MLKKNINLKRNTNVFASLLLLFSLASSQSLARSVLIAPQAAKQGQTIEIIVEKDKDSRQPYLSATGGSMSDGDYPYISFNGHNFKTYLQSSQNKDNLSSYRALIVIPANLKPGNYSIICDGYEHKIKVQFSNFPVQRIHLPSTKDNFIMSAGEEEAVDKAKATQSNEKLWHGTFKAPSKARISAKYGLRRIVNGKLLDDYFHSGLDYAGSLGSPVYATQGGKVILAHKGWRLHGNIICIDHGQGVVSFYIHLKDILVKQGQLVDSGQQIGKVGQTGRANGPHLHFSIYVNKDAANPQDWFTKVF